MTENRLQFIHDTYLWGSREEILNVISNNLGYNSDFTAVYGEPMVFRYGDNANPNIILAIGSVDKEEASDKKGKYFLIDYAHLEQSIQDVKDSLGEDTSKLGEVARILEEFQNQYKEDYDTLAKADEELQKALDSLKVTSSFDVEETSTVSMVKADKEDGSFTVSASVKVPEEKKIEERNIKNQLEVSENGLFYNIDLSCDKADNSLALSINGNEPTKIELPDGKYIASGEYSADTEEFILHYNDAAMEPLKISARELIEEWNVKDKNDQKEGIILSIEDKAYVEKGRRGQRLWQDLLTAKINFSEDESNLATLKDGALYVSKNAEDLVYDGKPLSEFLETLTPHESLSQIIKGFGYDEETETFWMNVKVGKTDEETVYFPAKALFDEFVVDDKHEHSVDVTLERVENGSSIISADVRISEKPNNLLSVDANHKLIVEGVAAKIKYGSTTVKDALKALEDTVNEIKATLTETKDKAAKNEEGLADVVKRLQDNGISTPYLTEEGLKYVNGVSVHEDIKALDIALTTTETALVAKNTELKGEIDANKSEADNRLNTLKEMLSTHKKESTDEFASIKATIESNKNDAEGQIAALTERVEKHETDTTTKFEEAEANAASQFEAVNAAIEEHKVHTEERDNGLKDLIKKNTDDTNARIDGLKELVSKNKVKADAHEEAANVKFAELDSTIDANKTEAKNAVDAIKADIEAHKVSNDEQFKATEDALNARVAELTQTIEENKTNANNRITGLLYTVQENKADADTKIADLNTVVTANKADANSRIDEVSGKVDTKTVELKTELKKEIDDNKAASEAKFKEVNDKIDAQGTDTEASFADVEAKIAAVEKHISDNDKADVTHQEEYEALSALVGTKLSKEEFTQYNTENPHTVVEAKTEGFVRVAVKDNVVTITESDKIASIDDVKAADDKLQAEINAVPTLFVSTNTVEKADVDGKVVFNVKKSTNDGNIIDLRGDGIFAKAPDFAYDPIAHKITYNGTAYPLNQGTLINNMTFDKESGEITIFFKGADGEQRFLKFNAAQMFKPLDVVPTEGAITLKLADNASGGQNLTASVNVSKAEDNMLHNESGELIVHKDTRIDTLVTDVDGLKGVVMGTSGTTFPIIVEKVGKLESDAATLRNDVNTNKNAIQANTQAIATANENLAAVTKAADANTQGVAENKAQIAENKKEAARINQALDDFIKYVPVHYYTKDESQTLFQQVGDYATNDGVKAITDTLVTKESLETFKTDTDAKFTAVNHRIDDVTTLVSNKFDTASDNISKVAESVTVLDEKVANNIAETNGKIDAAVARISVNETSIEDINNKIAADENSIHDAENRLTAVEGRMTKAEGDITATNTRIDGVDDRIDTVVSDLNTANQNITAANGRIDAAVGRLDAAEPRIMKTENDLVEANKKIAVLETEVNTLKEQLNELKALTASMKEVMLTAGNFTNGFKKNADKTIEVSVAEGRISKLLQVTDNGIDYVENPVIDCGSTSTLENP